MTWASAVQASLVEGTTRMRSGPKSTRIMRASLQAHSFHASRSAAVDRIGHSRELEASKEYCVLQTKPFSGETAGIVAIACAWVDYAAGDCRPAITLEVGDVSRCFPAAPLERFARRAATVG